MAKVEKKNSSVGIGTITDKKDQKPAFKRFMSAAIDAAFRGHGPAAQGIAARVKYVVVDDAVSQFGYREAGWFKRFVDQFNFTASVVTSCIYPKLDLRNWPEDNGLALTVSLATNSSTSFIRAVMGKDDTLRFQWHVTHEELDRQESPFRDFLKYLDDLNAGRVTTPTEDEDEDDDDDE